MEKLCRRFLKEYFQLLASYQLCFAPRGTLELVDERYLEACRNIDGIEYLLECMDKHPEETMQATEVRAILDRIPPEVFRAYAQRGKQAQHKEGMGICRLPRIKWK